MVCYNPYVQGNDGHTRCAYIPVPLLGLTSASTWLVYMHVTELHVCKCTTWYSKEFFVINTTLTCITQMIISLCESACIYALGIQTVKSRVKKKLQFSVFDASHYGQQFLPRQVMAVESGNPRRTFRLRSVFSTFPTDRTFEFKLEIKGNRRY